MEKKKSKEYAGSLIKELEEIAKIELNEHDAETKSTHTIECSAFLTIYCC